MDVGDAVYECPDCKRQVSPEDFTPFGVCFPCAEKEKRDEEGSGGFFN